MRSFTLFTALALAAFALPAPAQHPRLESGPASLLTGAPVYEPAWGAQRPGAIVPTPEGWLALWVDDIMKGQLLYERRLLATRLRPDGSTRDTTGIRVVENIGARYTAVSSPDGARIFWAMPGSQGFALHTATVSDDGEVSGTVVVGEYPGDAVRTTLAAAVTGSRHAVLLDRYVMIVDGTRLVRTVDLGGFSDLVSIVAAGSRFVVTWVASGDVLMRQTLDLEGNAIGPQGGIGTAFPASLHSLATDGSTALLAWSDASGIRIATIDPESGAFAERSTIASAAWAWPHLVWTGSSYLLTWNIYGNGAIVGVHVSADGVVIDAEPQTLFDGTPNYYFVGARGSDALMLLQSGSCIRFMCEIDVYAARLDSSPAQHWNLVSAAARNQTEPAIASDGTGFLTMWREGPHLFVTEMADRSRAQSAPVPLADVFGYGSSVASTGNGYLATWVAFREGRYFVEGALAGQGAEPPRKVFSLDVGGNGPFVISSGASSDMYLVVWRDASGLFAVRIGTGGELLDRVPFPLPSDTIPWAPPSVAFDDRDFVVGLLSATSGTSPAYVVTTLRVSTAGISRVDRTWATAELGTIQNASMACGADACLIVWTARVDPYGLTWQVYGMRFRAGGEPIDSTPLWLDVPDTMQSGTQVSWDGSRFVVTWRKYIGDTGPEKIEARTVPVSGEVDRDFPDFLTERDPNYPAPVVTCNRQGRCVIVGPDSADDTILGRSTRLFKRFFGEPRYRTVRR